MCAKKLTAATPSWWMSPRTAAITTYTTSMRSNIYTGKFSKVGKRALGETIEIRYDPDAPEKSNWVLEMGIKTILKDVFMIAIFWTWEPA